MWRIWAAPLKNWLRAGSDLDACTNPKKNSPMKYLLFLLMPLAAFAITEEQFKGMDFQKIVAKETAPDGSPSVVIGVEGEVQGVHRVAIGVIHAAGGAPEVHAIFFLSEEGNAMVSVRAGENWRTAVIKDVDSSRAEIILEDLLELKEESGEYPGAQYPMS